MSSTAQTVAPTMSLEALQQTREWSCCTAKQRLWIQTWIDSNRDYFLATRLSYQSKNDLNCLILSHKIRKQDAVVAVVRLWDPNYGREVELDEQETREQFFDAIKRKIMRGKLSIADVEAIKMVCRERGWDTPILPRAGRNGYMPVAQREPREFFVGQVVTVNGKKIRVTKLNSDGRPVAGDPVKD